jgi:hypothetical protein
MEARVFDGVLMVDGDVTWFDGERDTWNELEHLVARHMAFGGPTILTKGINVSLGGLMSPLKGELLYVFVILSCKGQIGRDGLSNLMLTFGKVDKLFFSDLL